MIRPTPRAVLIFVLGIPLALFLVINDPQLWPWSFDYGAVVLVAIAADFALAFPSRRLILMVDVPETLQIGEQGNLAATIGKTRYARATRFELLCEQRGEADAQAIVKAELVRGRDARIDFPIVPRARGRVFIDAI